MTKEALVFFLCGAVIAVAGQPQIDNHRRQASAAHIRRLSTALRTGQWLSNSGTAKRQELTRQLQGAIDQYLQVAFSGPRPDAPAVRTALDDLLLNHRFEKGYGGPPFVKVEGTGTVEQRLFVAYALKRGNQALDDPAVALRAYANVDDTLSLVAATGEDLDGFSLFVLDIPAPVSGESWFLCYGYQAGNGPHRRRVRIYAFGGGHFRTVWRPDDELEDVLDGADVSVTGSAIKIHRLDPDRYYRTLKAPFHVITEYLIQPDGILKVNSTPID
ncbi:hypothetical protein [uncultured Paludibaculum sp.]|uniref:hypothetical protein n=1 Tax=uncultured Paludibaculum sp. TaxID=1765020 RepID=UPI002AAC395C|nr:hypothetical protein [uncultured Paludibaculum sp.]